MKQTEHYQLNQYEPTDAFLRTDFNADNQKLDAALKKVADKADSAATRTELAQLSQRVDGKAEQAELDRTNASLAQKCEIYLGSYAGDDAASRTIDLGFPPKAVYLCSQNGRAGEMYGTGYIYGGLAMPGKPVVMENNIEKAVEVTDTGFRLTHDGYRRVNSSNLNYYYFAIK